MVASPTVQGASEAGGLAVHQTLASQRGAVQQGEQVPKGPGCVVGAPWGWRALPIPTATAAAGPARAPTPQAAIAAVRDGEMGEAS